MASIPSIPTVSSYATNVSTSSGFSDYTIDALFKDSVVDYSLSEVWQLEDALQELRKMHGNRSERYLRMKELVAKVRMTHLPLRSYVVWKNDSPSPFKSRFFFENHSPLEKEDRKAVKTGLRERSLSPEMQERLKLISRLTFIHGSNSSSLAMMLLREDPCLLWSGALLAQNIAPMYGELCAGVGVNGINLGALSTETVRDVKRIVGYTHMNSFHLSQYVNIQNPYLMLTMDNPENVSILFQTLNKWREEFPEEYFVEMSPGKQKTKLLIDAAKVAISKCERSLESTGYQESTMRHSIFQEWIDNTKSTISLLTGFISELERGGPITIPPVDCPSLEWIDLDKNLENLREPFSMVCKEFQWNRNAIKILQMKQWDKTLFDQTILPNRQMWIDSIEKERVLQRKPLLLLLAIINHEFTEDEAVFIKAYKTQTGFSHLVFPESLRAVFSSVNEISRHHVFEWAELQYNSMIGDMAQYRNGNYSWDYTLALFLHFRLRGKDLTEYKPFLENQLSLIDRNYERIMSALQDVPAAITIPQDETIRALITQPIPIIFSSTTVKPKPHDGHKNPAEFLLDTPTRLGKGGADIMFTDTVESIEKIRAILPDHLKSEIEIHLFKDLDVGDMPLIHSPDQVSYEW